MSDSELTLRIAGDASGVQEAADQAKEQIERAAQSVSMLGDLIGVKVPEGVQKLIASSELIGPALSTAFDGIAIVGLIQLVIQVAEEIKSFSGTMQGLTKAETDQYDKATKAAKEHLQVQEAQVRAEYELQIAQASTDIEKQALRVKEAASLVDVSKNYLSQLKEQKRAFDDMIASANSSADAMEKGAEVTDYDIEKGADLSLLFANQQRQKATAIQTDQKYLDLQKEIDLAVARVTQEQAAQVNAQTALANARVVDIGNITRAHSKLADQIKKNAEESAKADDQAALALAQYWQDVAAAAQKSIDDTRNLAGKELQDEIKDAQDTLKGKEALLQRDLAQHKITQQQEIAAVAQAKLQELQQEAAYYTKLRNLYQAGTTEWNKYQHELTRIQHQEVIVRANAETQAAKAVDSQYKSLFSSLTNSFKSFADSIINGNQSIAQDFQALYTGLLKDTINWLEQMLAKKIEMYATEKIFTKQKAAGDIAASSGQAFAGAFASVMASLPFPLNVATAPGVAAAAGGAAETGGLALTMAEYALGGIVPATGLALVHEGEKILPRSMSGNGSGLGGPAVHVHVNLNAIDAESFRGTVSKHGNMIGNEVAKVLRKKGFYSG